MPSKNVINGKFEPYCCTEVLQKCLMGKVHLGVGLFTGSVVAIKSVSAESVRRSGSSSALPETPLAEVFFAPLLKDCNHFIKLIEVVHQDGNHYIVSEYANGEDLIELLKQYPNGINELTGGIIIRQMVEAVLSYHERGIALQDFSLENCLMQIQNEEGDCRLLICDPGQACVYNRDAQSQPAVKYSGQIGKQFRPPEILEGRPLYNPCKVDSWCLGWAAWYLLYAAVIFECVEDDPRYALFLARDVDGLLKYSQIENASAVAVDFVFSLMDPDPAKRMTMEEALQHPFLEPSKGKALNVHTLSLRNEDLAVKPLSAIKTALTSLSLFNDNPDRRYKLFRVLVRSLEGLASAISDHDASVYGAKPSSFAGELQRCRYILKKVAEMAPYVPSMYTRALMPALCDLSRPSATLLDRRSGNTSPSSVSTAPSTTPPSPGSFVLRSGSTRLGDLTSAAAAKISASQYGRLPQLKTAQSVAPSTRQVSSASKSLRPAAVKPVNALRPAKQVLASLVPLSKTSTTTHRPSVDGISPKRTVRQAEEKVEAVRRVVPEMRTVDQHMTLERHPRPPGGFSAPLKGTPLLREGDSTTASSSNSRTDSHQRANVAAAALGFVPRREINTVASTSSMLVKSMHNPLVLSRPVEKHTRPDVSTDPNRQLRPSWAKTFLQ